MNTSDTIRSLHGSLDGLAPDAMLRSLADAFGSSAVFSTSLGLEDQLITHHIFSQKLPIRVFTLDTGRLFPESHDLLARTISRYNARIEVLFPRHEAVEALMTEKGPDSFYRSVADRKECCAIRKVEPLGRALNGAACWITGLRAEQSPERSRTPMVEWDEAHGLVKVHPLIGLNMDEVRAEVERLRIPYNPLHDRGFVSIGCAPCTRAIAPGEDARAGRWWWEHAEGKKECGLHVK